MLPPGEDIRVIGATASRFLSVNRPIVNGEKGFITQIFHTILTESAPLIPQNSSGTSLA